MSSTERPSTRRQLSAVVDKEMRDAVRDRRSVLSALLYPLFGPLVVAMMLGAMMERMSAERPLEVAVVGREHAPRLMAFLEEKGAVLKALEGDPKEAVEERRVDFALVVEESYGEQLAAGDPAELQLIHDGARDDIQPLVRRTQGLLSEYGSTLATLRLIARGIDPAVVRPLKIEEQDLATSEQLAARLFAMLPLLLVMAAFIASLNVAIDATAGERERLSLEPLLTLPVPRHIVVAGKWLVASAFSLAGVLLTLPCFLVAMRFVPLEELGLRLDIGPVQVAWMIVLLAPMSLLAAALQMAVATFARSFKEAQTYVNLLNLAPMLPGFISMVQPVDTTLWMAFVPGLAQQQLLVDLMGGQAPALVHGLASVAVTTAGALLLVVLTARLLGNERIVFGR
jgi:sodium transport system permease protein